MCVITEPITINDIKVVEGSTFLVGSYRQPDLIYTVSGEAIGCYYPATEHHRHRFNLYHLSIDGVCFQYDFDSLAELVEGYNKMMGDRQSR